MVKIEFEFLGGCLGALGGCIVSMDERRPAVYFARTLNRILVTILLCIAGSGWIVEHHLESTQPGQTFYATGDEPPFQGRDLLDTMTGAVHKEDGVLVLHGQDRIATADKFAPPVRFKIIAMTDGTNIRIRYAANQIIFNWEVSPDELRIDGGPADGRHLLGAGRVPVGQWVQIGIDVTPTTMILSVDGKQRYHTNADFSKIKQRLIIFPANGSNVKVQSVQVEKD